jgi:hypothetical protein
VDVERGARCRIRHVVLFENKISVWPANCKCGLSRL